MYSYCILQIIHYRLYNTDYTIHTNFEIIINKGYTYTERKDYLQQRFGDLTIKTRI